MREGIRHGDCEESLDKILEMRKSNRVLKLETEAILLSLRN
jgi:hypothetical protein